ncbi:MAG: RNA polymerase subunit sigma [Verrucomicrobiae bacterium]|nr:RNA polymerase subunit sigma [Verrucomicrobiae bacterium]
MPNITQLLNAAGRGDPSAPDRLLAAVYEELRQLAAQRLNREQPGHTLQPTALVHEAWLRLGGDRQPVWENRGHFFAAAAEAMRRILVDAARRKARHRHGGDQIRVPLTDLDVAATATPELVLAVGEALGRLARHDPQGAELIKLRFFVGLSNVEAAQALGLPERSAKRVWAYARAWLLEELRR